MRLSNFIADTWHTGTGSGQSLFDPTLGTPIASASTEGIDLASALTYSRQVGSRSLRALNYAARGALLARIAEVLIAHREDYLRIALENSGSPASDASIDIDGALYTLKYFAKLGAGLGDARYFQEGDTTALSKDGLFGATHFLLPLEGVAVLVNAFNFPAWGLWEKAAPALLSGVPILAKPATSTALLTYRMVKDVIDAGVLPPGALSLVCGPARDLPAHLDYNDVLAFTGSADTARSLRTHPAVLDRGVRVNVEADSLNAAILGPDATTASEEFSLFVREVVREMTIKAGQKCTAIRRVLVPAELADDVSEAIATSLGRTVVGNPRDPTVRMGPLACLAQRDTVEQGIAALSRIAERVTPAGPFQPLGADVAAGAFVAPTLFRCRDALAETSQQIHDLEVFGPVATVIPYESEEQAYDLAGRGKGSLVTSVFSADEPYLARAALRLAAGHGRVLCVGASIGKTHTGHGNAMPQCLHGGPGRAGNGEELGGLRALLLFHRRSVIQGTNDLATRLGAVACRWNV